MSLLHTLKVLYGLAGNVTQMGPNGLFGISVEITQVCPMSCPDCYVPVIKHGPHGLPIEKWVEIIQGAADKGVPHLTIVGGEPGARRKELHHVVGLTKVTWIVTTFFYEMPTFERGGNQVPVTYIVSVDGTDEIHDQLRAVPGLAQRARKHITTAREKAHAEGKKYPVFSHTVLLAANNDVMEHTIWQLDRFEGIDGMVFSTAVPTLSDPYPAWSPTEQQRADFVELLLRSKKAGARINMSYQQIVSLHPDYTRGNTPSNCAVSQRTKSYDFHGNPKEQCIFGRDSDCSQCGCVVKTGIDPLYRSTESQQPPIIKLAGIAIRSGATTRHLANMIEL